MRPLRLINGADDDDGRDARSMRPLKAKIALEAVREQATVADLAHRYKVMSRSALQRLPDQPPHEKGQRDRA